MPRKTTTKAKDEEVKLSSPEETEEIENEEVETENEEKIEDNSDAVDILLVKDPNSKDYTGAIFVRQYSNEVHGEDFEDLADEFCTKEVQGGKKVYLKVPTNKIAKVEVRYREKSDYDTHLDDQDPNAPIVDKVKMFEDKAEAVRFGSQKIASTVVVSRSKVVKVKK